METMQEAYLPRGGGKICLVCLLGFMAYEPL